MLLGVCSRWSLPGANTNEDAYISTWPLADGGFVEYLRRRVVFPRPFIDEYILPYLYWFERKTCSACCPTRLPNCAVEFRWRLSP